MISQELGPIDLDGRERFNTTQWTDIVSAADPNSPECQAALEKLCNAYWPPLYAFLRRSGHSAHEAQDLTQGFFERLLERNFIAAADRERGRFRSFLLTALKHYVANDWQARHAQKRGGKHHVISFDQESAEGRYCLEPADHLTPELLFDRHWAWTVVERVMNRLNAEYALENPALFNELKAFLTAKQPVRHAEIAAHHGITANAVGVAIYRLRQKYAKLLRDEIAQTVHNPAEVEDEIRYLISALGS